MWQLYKVRTKSLVINAQGKSVNPAEGEACIHLPEQLSRHKCSYCTFLQTTETLNFMTIVIMLKIEMYTLIVKNIKYMGQKCTMTLLCVVQRHKGLCIKYI